MKQVIQLSLIVLFFTGCARIPTQSVTLTDALQVEGERMHKINVLLFNRVFNTKEIAIEKFINDEYTPVLVKNLIAQLPPNTDYKANFPALVQAIIPKINARKDSLLDVLGVQKEKIIEKLNTDYKVFDNAAVELKRLLASAAKIDKEKQALIDRVKELSQNKIDFNTLESAFDKFITSAGSVSSSTVTFTEDINKIVK